MAKGWSGSPRHTEKKGASIGGRDPAPRSVAMGPGAAAGKVRPDIMRQVSSAGASGASSKKPSGMKTYNQE